MLMMEGDRHKTLRHKVFACTPHFLSQSEPMSIQQESLEHLRLIRSLLEKSAIYRAISGPAALLGGLLAIGLSLWQYLAATAGAAWEARVFLASWLVLLALVTVVNVGLLAADARRRGRALVSPEMRMALRALAGPMLVGGVAGILLILQERPAAGAVAWMCGQGLALHSAASFSPRSLVWLGRAFTLGGVTAMLLLAAGAPDLPEAALAPLLMGLSFGLGHLIYGAAVRFGPGGCSGGDGDD
jgi:hypothetical protein